MSLHNNVLTTLSDWQTPDRTQETLKEAFIGFLKAREDACLRQCEPGHITASALVLNSTNDQVLLTLHPRVGRWIQLGGHCESSDNTILDTAFREATEESGINNLTVDPTPLQIDVHPITCSLGIPTRHFDIRFVAHAPDGAQPTASNESLDLKWWPVTALPSNTDVIPELVKLALGIPMN